MAVGRETRLSGPAIPARSEQSWDRFKGRLNHNKNEEENSANECGGKL
jgi:hypothetical protein